MYNNTVLDVQMVEKRRNTGTWDLGKVSSLQPDTYARDSKHTAESNSHPARKNSIKTKRHQFHPQPLEIVIVCVIS